MKEKIQPKPFTQEEYTLANKLARHFAGVNSHGKENPLDISHWARAEGIVYQRRQPKPKTEHKKKKEEFDREWVEAKIRQHDLNLLGLTGRSHGTLYLRGHPQRKSK